MITDSADYRNENYHTAGDTPDTLDYERMAKVVAGVLELGSGRTISFQLTNVQRRQVQL